MATMVKPISWSSFAYAQSRKLLEAASGKELWSFATGVLGAFRSYPKGYRLQTVLTAGRRVTDTLMAWGDNSWKLVWLELMN